MKMFRMKFVFAALLALTLAAPVIHAQEAAPASPSTASGQKYEPEAVPEKDNPERKEAEGGEEAFRKSPSVIKLGHMLGMEPGTASAVFEWFNAIVLLGAVGFGLVKALPKAFRARTEGIQKNIVEARVATEEAKARLSAVEGRLAKLDSQISALRAENEQAAAEEEVRIHAQAEEEKKRILEAAEQEITAASNAATRDLRAYAAEIAVDRAAAQLNITPEDDRILIESFAGRLSSVKPGAEGSRN